MIGAAILSVAANRSGGGFVPPVGPIPLSAIEAYRTSSTSWADVPWGPESWFEPTTGTTLSQVMDIWVPTTTRPPNGYPSVSFFHANGNTHKSLSNTFRNELLAAGLAVISVEFRHPVTNVALGAPHLDVGRAIQYLRALGAGLQLDSNRVGATSRSRGALCVWQALQPDLADGGSPTYQGRMSSRIHAVWAYAAQTTYSTTEFANTFIVPGDRAAFLALNPDDARWGSAIQSVATATYRPPMMIRHEKAHPTGLVSGAVADDIHYPGFGSAFRDAYIAAGASSLITALDLIPPEDATAGAAAWFLSKMP